MTHAEFKEHQEKLFEYLREVGETKGKEYANNDADRLANFKDIAKEVGASPELVCWIYTVKHLRAIASFIRTGQTYSEDIHGRIKDANAYLMLLDGLITERLKAQADSRPRAIGGLMNFSDACTAMDRGERVTRKGWSNCCLCKCTDGDVQGRTLSGTTFELSAHDIAARDWYISA